MPAARNWTAGIASGFAGMLGFSGTLAATRIAVADFTPLTITASRILIAAALGGLYLLLVVRPRFPRVDQVVSLIVMGSCLAVGYPFFLAVALQDVPAAHGAVVSGLAPAATALIAVVRLGERPSPLFWAACAAGFTAVLAYAYFRGDGHLSLADGWLMLAVLSLGIAYVEGAKVSAELGGSVALAWAMIFLSPVALAAIFLGGQDLFSAQAAVSSWAGLAYLGVVSMFLASVFWYRGLALGGAARIGQINLLLPVAGLLWASVILGETITGLEAVCAVIVLCAMAVCLRTRQRT